MPRLARALVVVVAAASLAGCASSVSLQPAKDADDPLCAEVTVRLPATIDGQERGRMVVADILPRVHTAP